jgi:hypothetical protein
MDGARGAEECQETLVSGMMGFISFFPFSTSNWLYVCLVSVKGHICDGSFDGRWAMRLPLDHGFGCSIPYGLQLKPGA